MRTTHLLGILTLSLVGCLALPSTTLATSVNSNSNNILVSADAKVPTKAELIAAIANLMAIENFEAYSKLSPSQLAQATPLAKYYTYYFNCVAVASQFVNSYDSASPRELATVYRSLQDAVTSFNLISGQAKREASKNQSQSSIQTTVKAPSANSTSQTGTAKAQTPANSQSHVNSSNNTNHANNANSGSASTTVNVTVHEAVSSKASTSAPEAPANNFRSDASAQNSASPAAEVTTQNSGATDQNSTDTNSRAGSSDALASAANAGDNPEVPATGDLSDKTKVLPTLGLIAIVASALAVATASALILTRHNRTHRPGRR